MPSKVILVPRLSPYPIRDDLQLILDRESKRGVDSLELEKRGKNQLSNSPAIRNFDVAVQVSDKVDDFLTLNKEEGEALSIIQGDKIGLKPLLGGHHGKPRLLIQRTGAERFEERRLTEDWVINLFLFTGTF